MSSLGHLSANPFGTLRGSDLQQDLHAANTSLNNTAERSSPSSGVESPFRDSDSDESPPPSANSSHEAQSLRSSRAFSSATDHTNQMTSNNPYVAIQACSSPNFDSDVTLNPYVNTGQSLNPYLTVQQQTNPFADTHLFIDPEEERPKVQQKDLQTLIQFDDEPDISHVLAYLQRGSTSTPVQGSTDDGHQSRNRLSEGSSALELAGSPPRGVRFQISSSLLLLTPECQQEAFAM